MNDSYYVRLAIRLLESLRPDCEALAGDLLEEAAQGRSHLWLGYQVLAAVLDGWAVRSATREIRPLRLVEHQPLDAIERLQRWASRSDAVNLSASPIASVGGLGLLILAVLVSLTAPAFWCVVVVSVLGSVIGAARFLAPRRDLRTTFTCTIRRTP